MSKTKRTAEFEVNASAKLLFPYISTPGGLQEWFADEVNISSEKVYNFVWDDEEHLAKMTQSKTNKMVRFEFDVNGEEEDPAYIQLDLVINELTQTLYLTITDYSELFDSEDEFFEMWEDLVYSLKEVLSV